MFPAGLVQALAESLILNPWRCLNTLNLKQFRADFGQLPDHPL